MTFTYWGRELELFDAPYNSTIHNERAVELAVAFDWLDGMVMVDGLEVGNVLAHYGCPPHKVVDLTEEAPGVDNIDVRDTHGHFDWIVSISTLEHVGHDFEPRDPHAACRALHHLRSLLVPGGRMLVTVPGGYHPALDEYLATGAGAQRDCTLVRTTAGWQQTTERTFLPYGASTPWAESLWIAEWGDDV